MILDAGYFTKCPASSIQYPVSMNIIFAHSNGFTAKTYRYFLEQLEPHKITAFDNIGMGTEWSKWKDFVPQLIHTIESNFDEPVVGLGHSLGAAVTFFAAEQRPDLFSKVIIIEPPIFSFRKRLLIWFFTQIHLADRFSPAGAAMKRRDFFENREAAYKALRQKGIFKRFDENCFQDYIDYGFKETENGITLNYPKALETEIFRNPPFFFENPQLTMPVHFIYSKYYKTLDRKDIAWWKKTFSYINFHECDGGHMLPLEKPHFTAKLLQQLIEE